MPRKVWGWLADCIASIATLTEPSVPFLNPIGKPEPDASSRWSCDSVVRAPMAPQVMRSAMNCGLPRQYCPPSGDHARRSGDSKQGGEEMLT